MPGENRDPGSRHHTLVVATWALAHKDSDDWLADRLAVDAPSEKGGSLADVVSKDKIAAKSIAPMGL